MQCKELDPFVLKSIIKIWLLKSLKSSKKWILLVPGCTFLILSNTAVVVTVAELLFQIRILPEFKAPAKNKPVSKRDWKSEYNNHYKCMWSGNQFKLCCVNWWLVYKLKENYNQAMNHLQAQGDVDPSHWPQLFQLSFRTRRNGGRRKIIQKYSLFKEKSCIHVHGIQTWWKYMLSLLNVSSLVGSNLQKTLLGGHGKAHCTVNYTVSRSHQ